MQVRMADHTLDATTDHIFHIGHSELHVDQNHVDQHGSIGLDGSDIDSGTDGEPSGKRLKSEEDDAFTETITIDWNDDNVKQTIYNVNRALTLRLDDLQVKYDNMCKTVQMLSKKLQQQQNGDKSVSNRGRGAAVVVGLPQGDGSLASAKQAFTATAGNVTLITLNNEADYPNGVWLGDEQNVEQRVRVPITPSDLLHIHSNCRTPEKMALTLLDYLFDRDTQAMSNLSGTGKHGKKQLDPLKIYGIRCHLIHRFGITEQDWHRIRLNIDSKCRTAFRRKVRGQSMGVKAFRMARDDGTYISYSAASDVSDDSQLHIQESLPLDGGGELQIIHATEEQLAQLQQSHQIQILEDNQVSAELLQQLQQQAAGGEQVITVASLASSHVSDVVLDPSSLQSQVHESELVGDGDVVTEEGQDC